VAQFWTWEWRYSLEAASGAWNDHAPGSKFKIYYDWSLAVPEGDSGDGEDDLKIVPSDEWVYGDYAAITKHRWSDCDHWNPWDVAHYTEVDILLNPNSYQWDKSTNPAPSDSTRNSTLILLHEFGHLIGLGEEYDVLASMNPDGLGGPVGNNNEVQPLGDDARGARAAYGTASTVRDVAASAMRLAASGTTRTIQAPTWTFRNAPLSFQFTVLNRGTTDETIPVHFYLSPTRTVNPYTSYYLGSTTVSLLYARSVTGTATVHIPANAPAGYQYIGWYTDPYNSIPEYHESNNGVSLAYATYMSDARRPDACFTATPTSGNAPLHVEFNAACTTDPDGDALTYTWDFGDGSTGSGQTTSHSYWTGGYYYVTLTVTDPYGATHSTSQTITVYCPPGSPWCEEPL